MCNMYVRAAENFNIKKNEVWGRMKLYIEHLICVNLTYTMPIHGDDMQIYIDMHKGIRTKCYIKQCFKV